eukprot:TRINITY_DN58511_c0_g1_i1.p1 TRINITY_DN58511_c0_g1~~TRINITY_DN58511_c0_g1_i1.p1  ORF type:complete len:180 (-),score=23.13 TRINITY_DN58511_c0_g1_i1:53-592(-)
MVQWTLLPQSPWEYAVLTLLLGIAIALAFRHPPPPPPPQPRKRSPPRGFTAEELRKYNGTNGYPIYLSLKNIVYEVAAEFYGPEGPYHCFAGKESTIPLGKSVISDQECNQDWSGMSPDDLSTAGEWEAKYQSKYPIVGWFVAPWVKEPPAEAAAAISAAAAAATAEAEASAQAQAAGQ